MHGFGRIESISSGGHTVAIAPDMGFAIVSWRLNGREILASETRHRFLKARKGLGPLILPHFNQAGPIPQVDVTSFPHVDYLRAGGIDHPFQHGIGRYVPWTTKSTPTSIVGRISGSHTLGGYALRDLTGFDFSALVRYRVFGNRLGVHLSVSGERPVAAGTHFYLSFAGAASAEVFLPNWAGGGTHTVTHEAAVDRVFPVKPPVQFRVAHTTLRTAGYELDVSFPVGVRPAHSFGSLIVYSPRDASFVCVEPISYAVPERNDKRHFSSTILFSLTGNTE